MNETEYVITSFAENVLTAASRVSELWLYPAIMVRSLFFISLPKQVKRSVVGMTKLQDYSVSLKNIIFSVVNIRAKVNLQSYMFQLCRK